MIRGAARHVRCHRGDSDEAGETSKHAEQTDTDRILAKAHKHDSLSIAK